MNIRSIEEFHEQAPPNATHVLKMGDKYEYANLVRGNYDSCDNATWDEMINNPTAGNTDWFFNVEKGDWEVYLELSTLR